MNGNTNWLSEVIIGTTDMFLDAAFLGQFGMTARRLPTLPKSTAAELYGLDHECRQLLLSPPDCLGAVRLIETPHEGIPLEPFSLGLHGIDIYTENLDLTRRITAELGARPGPATPYWVWGELIVESRIVSPGGTFAIMAVETVRQLPGAIRTRDGGLMDSNRCFSDLSTFLWFTTAERSDDDGSFWLKNARFKQHAEEITFSAGNMAQLMETPSGKKLGCKQFADHESTRRVEYLYYEGETSSKDTHWPLTGGMFGLALRLSTQEQFNEWRALSGLVQAVQIDYGDEFTLAFRTVTPSGLNVEIQTQKEGK